MYYGATAIGQAMSYDTSISIYKQRNIAGVLYGGQRCPGVFGTFLLYAQEAKNFTRRHQRWLLLP